MNPLVKVAVAAGGGAMLAQYVEPHLQKLVKPDSEFAKKAVNAAAIGGSAAAIFYFIKGT